jgi:hypothetical protein
LSDSGAVDYLVRVRYQNAEDRLNPIAPEGADETTLGGYLAVHGRAAAFEGADSQAYTAAIETERADDDPDAPWAAYLVLLRWAASGTAIMGHLETGDLATGGSEAEVRSALEALPLERVKEILDETIARKQNEEAGW